MKTLAPYLILALRIALAWWVGLVVVSALFSPAVAGLGGLLLFPPVALLIGAAAAWRQRRAVVGQEGVVSPLAVGRSQSINLALPAPQALRIAESAVKAVFNPGDLRLTDTTATARIRSAGVRQTTLAGLRDDALSIAVSADGAWFAVADSATVKLWKLP